MPDETWGHRFREGLRSYRYPISLVVLAVGVLLSFFAFGDFVGPVANTPVFQFLNPYTDPSRGGTNVGAPNYDLAFAVMGPIITIVGAYLVGSYVLHRRRFEHLMVTRSKAEFLRNVPDLEQLLWDLTPADEQRYLEKRAELKLRR